MPETVDIVGTPRTLSFLSQFVEKATVPVPNAANYPPASMTTVENLPSTSSAVQIIDLHLESEK